MHGHDDQFIRDIRHLQETMERLLSDFSSRRMPLLLSKETAWRPPTDVYETEKELVVRTEIPGLNVEDFKVILEDRVIIIKGARRDPTPSGKKQFHEMEINLGRFERNIGIPRHIHISSVDAAYENGFLVIRVTKGVAGRELRETVVPVERGM
jgi:HSP20 family protein